MRVTFTYHFCHGAITEDHFSPAASNHPKGGTTLNTLWHDLVYGLRILARKPLFTLAEYQP